MVSPSDQKLFPLGQQVMTSGVAGRIEANDGFGEFVAQCLNRHANGVWGDLSQEDKSLNDAGLKSGEDRLFSAYEHDVYPKIWIITEWDRSATTVLFPDEY